MKSKDDLRKSLMEYRSTIQNKKLLDNAIADKLKSLLSSFDYVKKIFTYISMGSEVDTRAIIEYYIRDKEIYCPYTTCDMEMNFYRLIKSSAINVDKRGNADKNFLGSSALVPTNSDIIIVPLCGFNDTLNRIGYGKGCYDRYFTDNSCGIKIGLGYQKSKVDFIADIYDIALDYIITEEAIYQR